MFWLPKNSINVLLFVNFKPNLQINVRFEADSEQVLA